jgi:hypothetical protein
MIHLRTFGLVVLSRVPWETVRGAIVVSHGWNQSATVIGLLGLAGYPAVVEELGRRPVGFACDRASAGISARLGSHRS